MEAAWNRGDFRGYMAGFKNPDVVFVSRGAFQQGWQGTLDHYVRDYGGAPERRGRLHFWDIRIEMLAPDAAQLIGRYRLEGGDHPQDGINTRLMRKVDGRWVIALNHVSSREPPRPKPGASEEGRSRSSLQRFERDHHRPGFLWPHSTFSSDPAGPSVRADDLPLTTPRG